MCFTYEQILRQLKASQTRARAGWTPALELGMLCVYWSLLYARQPANSFAFAKYDPQAVKDKLRKLRGRLALTVFHLPYHTNEEAFKRILASCKRTCASPPTSSTAEKGGDSGLPDVNSICIHHHARRADGVWRVEWARPSIQSVLVTRL